MSDHKPESYEPNEFIREEQASSAEEARRAAWAGASPSPSAGPCEDRLFEAHMRRFPRQHN